jgi:hypothetical protein
MSRDGLAWHFGAKRGFLDVVFCSIETAGERPSIWSTSGFCIISRNWRA